VGENLNFSGGMVQAGLPCGGDSNIYERRGKMASKDLVLIAPEKSGTIETKRARRGKEDHDDYRTISSGKLGFRRGNHSSPPKRGKGKESQFLAQK